MEESLNDSNSFRVYKLQGGSMYPFLRDGDKVLVSSTKSPRVGHIIIFKRKNGTSIVAHRIISINKDLFLTKGDNYLAIDTPIHKKDILGVCLGVIRNNNLVYLPKRLLLAKCWRLFNINLFLKEIIKKLLTFLQALTLYRKLVPKIIGLDVSNLSVKIEKRNDIEIIKFYCKEKYIAVMRREEKSKKIIYLYIRFLYRGLGLGKIIREYE